MSFLFLEISQVTNCTLQIFQLCQNYVCDDYSVPNLIERLFVGWEAQGNLIFVFITVGIRITRGGRGGS